jgi:hypothetical protein
MLLKLRSGPVTPDHARLGCERSATAEANGRGEPSLESAGGAEAQPSLFPRGLDTHAECLVDMRRQKARDGRSEAVPANCLRSASQSTGFRIFQ